MFKLRTSKVRHRKQVILLQARVMSPRIAWFRFLGACMRSMKVFLLLGLVAAAGWGIYLGVERVLFKNEEFKLQTIRMNPNSAVDVDRLVEVTNLKVDGTLFDCDLGEIEKSLTALPEVVSADAKRDFPGTLVVKIVPRHPVVWIACERAENPIRPRDPRTGLLVDASGFAYTCPAGQLEDALKLPVIVLNPDSSGAAALASGHQVVDPEFDRTMALHAAAVAAEPDADKWIDSIRQSRIWALEMTTRDGMKATFGLGDHERQIQDLIAAVNHSRTTGQAIASISLIPRTSLPVVLRDSTPPRASVIEDEAPEPPAKAARSRRESDLKQLLNRH